MKKKKILILSLLVLTVRLFAEKPPIAGKGWRWDDGQSLNGKWFYDVSDSYREQDGWAYIEGLGKIHYWLYDTYSYHDGYGWAIVDIYVPRWIESMGYVIDFDNIEIIAPNTDLAYSVKALMAQRGCDMSVALITSNPSAPYVVINNYNSYDQSYWTQVIPLIK